MVFEIFKGFTGILVCITVFTAIQAGIVCTYIPTFDTMTALPHSFMFQVFE